ncbi:OX-2 membrane glycoprotein-like, partial [Clarias magur]
MMVMSLYFTVCSAGILNRDRVNVTLGEDATLTCELPDADGVKQVIWQRREGEALRNMVSFTERSKPHVDDAFAGKVNVTVASIQRTTIVIKDVTFADEACYVCTFSVYPSGTERKTACLTVQGLSKITSQVSSKPKEKETVVSCSATGKSNTVISWRSEKNMSNYPSNNDTKQNGDNTVTITSNITIPLSEFSGKHVKCVVKSDNIERIENILVEKQMDEETPNTSRYYVCSVIVIISGVLVSCIAFLYHQRRK